MTKTKKPPKAELIRTAKNLYLEPNHDGSHRYSLEQIRTEIERQFGCAPSKSTLHEWAKKEQWETIFLAGASAGATSAIIEAQPEATGKTQDEITQDAIAKQRAQDWAEGRELRDLALNHIRAKGFANTKEAIAAYQAGLAATKLPAVEGKTEVNVNLHGAVDLSRLTIDELESLEQIAERAIGPEGDQDGAGKKKP